MNFLQRIRRKGLKGCVTYLLEQLGVTESSKNKWKGEYQSWAEACTASGGYDKELIFEKVLSASKKVRDHEAVFERDSVVFDHVEYSWPLLAGLMWGAAMHEGSLRILDFGGALGSSYRQNKKFLSYLKEVSWNVVEQRHFVSCGKQHFTTDQLSFYYSIDECLATQQVDGIAFLSVLQYLESPYDMLKSLSQYNFDYVIIDRTPFSLSNKHRITVQHVPANIYQASYPCHLLSEDLFLEATGGTFRVVEWFESGRTDLFTYKGCILSRF